jgi:hypothetical protein
MAFASSLFVVINECEVIGDSFYVKVNNTDCCGWVVMTAIVQLGDGNMPNNCVVNEFVEQYKRQLEEEKKNKKKKLANNANNMAVASVAAEDAEQDVDDDEVTEMMMVTVTTTVRASILHLEVPYLLSGSFLQFVALLQMLPTPATIT